MIEDTKTYNGHTYSAGVQYQACMDGYMQGRADVIDEVIEIVRHNRNYFITNGIAELFIDIELEQLKEKKDE